MLPRSLQPNEMDKLRLFVVLAYSAIMPVEQYASPVFGLTYGKLFGTIVLILLFPYIFDKNRIQTKITLPIILFLLWVFVVTLIYSFEIYHGYSTLLMSVVVSAQICNYTSYDIKRSDCVILSIILFSTVLSLMAKEGVGASESLDGRISVDDINSNILAIYAAVSITAIVYFIRKWKSKWRYVLLAVVPLCLYSLANSGSKGGFISLLIGIFTIFMFDKKRGLKKMRIIVLGIGVTAMFAAIMYSTPIMQERMDVFLEDRTDVSREKIWEKAYQIFEENPIAGVGMIGYQKEMLKKYGAVRDTHNVYLYVLVIGGVIGFVLLLIFLYNVFRYIYKNTPLIDNQLAMALFLIIMFNWYKGGSMLFNKFGWLILGYSLGVAIYANRSKISK